MITSELPRQSISESQTETLISAAEAVEEVLVAGFIITFLLGLVLKGIMSQLWNIFNTLQIILALPLMDVVMPGMNGFQATRKLTHDPRTADIPVIMITTKDQETDKIWGMRQRAVEYIVKPVGQKELVARIKSVMAA